MLRLGVRIDSILTMGVSASAHENTKYGGKGHVETAVVQVGVSVKYLLPGLTTNLNAPTSSLAYDRRPARAPVKFRIYGKSLRFRVYGLDY